MWKKEVSHTGIQGYGIWEECGRASRILSHDVNIWEMFLLTIPQQCFISKFFIQILILLIK